MEESTEGNETTAPMHVHGPETRVHNHADASAESSEAHMRHNKQGIDASSYKQYIIPLALYLVVGLVNYWPVTLSIATRVAGIGGDPYQMLWHLWWVPYSIFTLHTSPWYTYFIYWPLGANLIYETMIPIAALLSWPLQIVSLPFAYNFIFFLGFALSGISMYLLANYLTKSKAGAFVAGLVFNYSTFHITQSYGHLQYANLEWVPFTIYFVLKILDEKEHRLKNSVFLSISIVFMLFMAGIDVGVITIAFIIFMLVSFLFAAESRQKLLDLGFWKYMGVGAVATFILGAWAFIPIIGGLAKNGLGTANYLNDIPHNMIWSDDVLSFLLPSLYNGIFNNLSSGYAYVFHNDFAETSAYITYTVLALAIFGAMRNLKESRMWIAAIVVFALLALGPYIMFNTNLNSYLAQSNGNPSGIPGLYMIYRIIPVLQIIREPGRFDLIVTLAFAVLAAYGAKAVDQIVKSGHDARTRRYIAVAVISVLFLAESNGMPLSGTFAQLVTSYAKIPPFYRNTLANYSGNFSVLQLPITPNPYSSTPALAAAKAMFYMTAGHRPLLGGYPTRENISQQLSIYQVPLALQATNLQVFGNINYSSPVTQNTISETLLTLYNYNTGVVVLDKTAYGVNTTLPLIEAYLLKIFGPPIYNDNYTAAFQTQRSIQNSLFTGFVSYPVLVYWSYGHVPIGLKSVPVWVPNTPGEIIVYAPYPNNTSFSNGITTGLNYTVNGTMRFTAISLRQSSPISNFAIYEQYGNLKPGQIASINVTPAPTNYSLKARFLSGPQGNKLYLVSGTGLGTANQSNGTVGILNLTISKTK